MQLLNVLVAIPERCFERDRAGDWVLPERWVALHTGDIGYTIGPLQGEQRCPGIIVLPGGSGDEAELFQALFWVITAFGYFPESRLGEKVLFTHHDTTRVRKRDIDTGAMRETWYRFTRHGPSLIWAP